MVYQLGVCIVHTSRLHIMAKREWPSAFILSVTVSTLRSQLVTIFQWKIEIISSEIACLKMLTTHVIKQQINGDECRLIAWRKIDGLYGKKRVLLQLLPFCVLRTDFYLFGEPCAKSPFAAKVWVLNLL